MERVAHRGRELVVVLMTSLALAGCNASPDEAPRQPDVAAAPADDNEAFRQPDGVGVPEEHDTSDVGLDEKVGDHRVVVRGVNYPVGNSVKCGEVDKEDYSQALLSPGGHVEKFGPSPMSEYLAEQGLKPKTEYRLIWEGCYDNGQLVGFKAREVKFGSPDQPNTPEIKVRLKTSALETAAAQE